MTVARSFCCPTRPERTMVAGSSCASCHPCLGFVWGWEHASCPLPGLSSLAAICSAAVTPLSPQMTNQQNALRQQRPISELCQLSACPRKQHPLLLSSFFNPKWLHTRSLLVTLDSLQTPGRRGKHENCYPKALGAAAALGGDSGNKLVSPASSFVTISSTIL